MCVLMRLLARPCEPCWFLSWGFPRTSKADEADLAKQQLGVGDVWFVSTWVKHVQKPQVWSMSSIWLYYYSIQLLACRSKERKQLLRNNYGPVSNCDSTIMFFSSEKVVKTENMTWNKLYIGLMPKLGLINPWLRILWDLPSNNG